MSLAQTLREAGFAPATEGGFVGTYSAPPSKTGTFYRVNTGSAWRTVAVDETGQQWIVAGRVDLGSLGFRICGPGIRRYLLDGFHKIRNREFSGLFRLGFWKAAGVVICITWFSVRDAFRCLFARESIRNENNGIVM